MNFRLHMICMHRHSGTKISLTHKSTNQHGIAPMELNTIFLTPGSWSARAHSPTAITSCMKLNGFTTASAVGVCNARPLQASLQIFPNISHSSWQEIQLTKFAVILYGTRTLWIDRTYENFPHTHTHTHSLSQLIYICGLAWWMPPSSE